MAGPAARHLPETCGAAMSTTRLCLKSSSSCGCWVIESSHHLAQTPHLGAAHAPRIRPASSQGPRVARHQRQAQASPLAKAHAHSPPQLTSCRARPWHSPVLMPAGSSRRAGGGRGCSSAAGPRGPGRLQRSRPPQQRTPAHLEQPRCLLGLLDDGHDLWVWRGAALGVKLRGGRGSSWSGTGREDVRCVRRTGGVGSAAAAAAHAAAAGVARPEVRLTIPPAPAKSAGCAT